MGLSTVTIASNKKYNIQSHTHDNESQKFDELVTKNDLSDANTDMVDAAMNVTSCNNHEGSQHHQHHQQHQDCYQKQQQQKVQQNEQQQHQQHQQLLQNYEPEHENLEKLAQGQNLPIEGEKGDEQPPKQKRQQQTKVKKQQHFEEDSNITEVTVALSDENEHSICEKSDDRYGCSNDSNISNAPSFPQQQQHHQQQKHNFIGCENKDLRDSSEKSDDYEAQIEDDDYDPQYENSLIEAKRSHARVALDELSQMVYEKYWIEARKAKENGYKLPRKEFSLKDIDWNEQGKKCVQPEITIFELVDAWKTLVDKLCHSPVCLDLIPHMEEAFYEIFETTDDERAFLSENEVSIRSDILTLVVLLGRCVDHYNHDKSISARFTTLLEVLLSYIPGWTPSEEVSRLWVRLMQPLSNDILPLNFRRKAYRVLVSLTWVPSSKGLMKACSFEHMMKKSTVDYNSSDQEAIKAHMQQISDGIPLPRYDCVNQLLDRLKDETDVCVAIVSKKHGMGKTTLAGQVASHPSIQKVFTVLWLNIKNDTVMTYECYLKYLNELCSQLPAFKTYKGQTPKVTWPKYIKRFEEPALRKLREQDCINQAKRRMSEILLQQQSNRYILLVLDDITDGSLIDRFRFFERQSLIVTTSSPGMEAYVDWKVELGPMSEEEAVQLFLKEARLPEDHILGSTVEMQTIIEKSGCVPLLVRTMARWYNLKQVTAGMSNAIQEILKELEALDENHDDYNNEDPNQLLYDVLSLMMGPSFVRSTYMSTLFVLCFAAMVVVFDDVCPLDSVLLLWDQVLKLEPMGIEELRYIVNMNSNNKEDSNEQKQRLQLGWCIAEGLSHMGVISVVEVNNNPWVHVHHQLYRKFAVLMASQMELKESFSASVASWNLAFVTAYFQKRIICDKKDFDDNSWDYAIRELPTHLCKAKTVPTAVAVLSDETFFQARIETLGWDRAIEQQIMDCVSLQQLVEQGSPKEVESRLLPASTVFLRCAEMIQDSLDASSSTDAEITVKECRALYNIGFSLAENGYYNEAIEHFEYAQDLAPQSRNLRASILYSACWALLANNDPKRAKKKIIASRRIMDQTAEPHVLYKDMLLVYADALIETCDYKEAASFLDAIVDNLANENNELECKYPVELGTALLKKGRLNFIMGDTELARCTLHACIGLKTEIGETSRSLSMAYGILGDVYMELHNVMEAKKCYEAGLKTLGLINSSSNQLDHRLMSAKLQYVRNDYDGCYKSFSVIRRTITESPLKFLDQSAYDLRIMSRMYLEQGDGSDAISTLRTALSLASDRPNSLERGRCLIELGNSLIEEGNGQEGLECFEQALEIQVATLDESVQVIDTLKLIGRHHLSLSRYDESLTVFGKAYEIVETIALRDIDRVADILFLIGDCYTAKGDFLEAGAHYDECLRVLRTERSEVHADVGKVHHRMGVMALSCMELEKALQYFKEALRIRKMNFDEKLSAETMHYLGVVQRKLGDLNVAKRSLLEALEIRKNYRSSKESAETLLELANVYRKQLQFTNAERLLIKGIEVLGDDDVYLGLVHLTLGHVKLSHGEFSEALVRYQAALDIRESTLGHDNVFTANAHRSIGLAYFLLDNMDAAKSHWSNFVTFCQDHNSLLDKNNTNTNDYILVTILLGDIYIKFGQCKEAHEAWNRAATLRTDVTLEWPFLDVMLDQRLGDGSPLKGSITLSPADITEIQAIIFIDD